MRADDRCAGRTPSHCAAARAEPTLNLTRGERGAREGGAVNKLRAGPCPRATRPLSPSLAPPTVWALPIWRDMGILRSLSKFKLLANKSRIHRTYCARVYFLLYCTSYGNILWHTLKWLLLFWNYSRSNHYICLSCNQFQICRISMTYAIKTISNYNFCFLFEKSALI